MNPQYHADSDQTTSNSSIEAAQLTTTNESNNVELSGADAPSYSPAVAHSQDILSTRSRSPCDSQASESSSTLQGSTSPRGSSLTTHITVHEAASEAKPGAQNARYDARDIPDG
jgi:hypothetical protein